MSPFIVNVKSLLVLLLVLSLAVVPGHASTSSTPLILDGAPVGVLASWVSETANRTIVIPDAMNFKVWLRSPAPSPSSALSLLKSTALVNGWEMTDRGGIISFAPRDMSSQGVAAVASVVQSNTFMERPPVELFYQSYNFLNRPASEMLPIVQSMAGDARLTLGPSNSLMVTAPQEVLNRLRAQMPVLDILRARFRVEAIISEEINGLNQQLGVNLDSTGSTGTLATNTGASIAGASVVAQLVALGDFSALYTYLSSSSDYKILSTPYILSDDGERGSLHVGDNVSVQTGITAAGGQVTTTYSRQDVGVILSITVKKIGEKVALDILQEASSVSPSLIAGQMVTSQRKITSKVSVNPGEIIDIGGLVSDSSRITKTGVPFLRDIPWLGALFRGQKVEVEKRNLRVYLRVIPA